MAVGDVLINALEHGNRGDANKPIGLGFSLLDDRLGVEVQDQGKGFDIADLPDPRQDECLLETSGRRVLLVRYFADELKVKARNNGGVTVLITKLYSNNSGSKSSK